MESNSPTGKMLIDGLTPEELAKDFMTAVEAGSMNMQFAVQVLIERTYVAATHDVCSRLQASNQKALFDQIAKARQERNERKAGRAN